MAAKLIVAVCVQFALFNVLQAQCLNRIPGGYLPTCGGPNIIPVAETLLPNQLLISPNYATPNYPAPILEVPYGLETIVSNPLAPTTIIQDSTVANNLANALQLLVVSNLLSNTLPFPSANEIVVPNYAPVLDYGMVSPVVSPCNYNPYSYVY